MSPQNWALLFLKNTIVLRHNVKTVASARLCFSKKGTYIKTPLGGSRAPNSGSVPSDLGHGFRSLGVLRFNRRIVADNVIDNFPMC